MPASEAVVEVIVEGELAELIGEGVVFVLTPARFAIDQHARRYEPNGIRR
ncbi:hypothetical protein ACWEJ6_54560 [Nonomuraea sp. NPDC004702]